MHANFNGGLFTESPRGATRRKFLQTAGLGLGSVALAGAPWFGSILKAKPLRKSVVFIYLKGGPSQLDMYDMKPEAPAEIRGEYRPIATSVPGMRVCELLPLQAKIADKLAIVNGVQSIDTHSSAALTGHSADCGTLGMDEVASVCVQIPSLPHGDWDTHGRVLGRRLSIFQELREKLPAYDRLIYELVSGIYDRGLDQHVLVVACGEFGRTPWINEHGGRNHWATSGSVLFAGGGLRTGQVIGDTGPIGEREQMRNRPYTAQNVLATIYRHLELEPAKFWDDSDPIKELV